MLTRAVTFLRTQPLVLLGILVVLAVSGGAGVYALTHPRPLAARPQPSPTPSTVVSDSPSESPLDSPSPEASPTFSRTPPPAPSPSNGLPHCTADQVTLTVATDHPSYPMGGVVTFLMRLTNVGHVRCDVDEGYLEVSIQDSQGHYLLRHPPGVQPYHSPFAPGPTYFVLDPGQSVNENDCKWDSGSYQGGFQGPSPYPGTHDAPPGDYFAAANWAYPQKQSAKVKFTINGPSPSASPSPSGLIP